MMRKNNKERMFPVLRNIVMFNRGVDHAERGLWHGIAAVANAAFGGAIDYQFKLELVRMKMGRIVLGPGEGGRDFQLVRLIVNAISRFEGKFHIDPLTATDRTQTA
jgi:hypothetical protein